jgi:hypothetical protein
MRSVFPLVSLGVALVASAAPDGGAWSAVALAFLAAMVPAVDLGFAVIGGQVGPRGWRLSDGTAASLLLAAVGFLAFQLAPSWATATAISGLTALLVAAVSVFFIRRLRQARPPGLLLRREVRLLGWALTSALGMAAITIASYASVPKVIDDPRVVGYLAWLALPLLPVPWAIAGSPRPVPVWSRPATALLFALAAVLISLAGSAEVLPVLSAAAVAAIGGWAALETVPDPLASEPAATALYLLAHAVAVALSMAAVLGVTATYLVLTGPA